MRCWESRNKTLDGMVAISLSGSMQSAFPTVGMWRNTEREASFREWMLPICRVLPPLGSQKKNPRAHGVPHLDILGKKQGLRFKRWMDDIDINSAFEYAIRDCTENAGQYLADYLSH